MKVIINKKIIEVEAHKTILEVARENGLFIPSLCDHSRLEPFGGCRLCIVEIKGRKGYFPSCSTYVEDGLEVRTETPKIKMLRREILELILSEHPHSCLICTEKEHCDEYKSTIRKVGEVTGCVLCSNNSRCELQDVVEALKIKRISFPALYRNFEIRKDDPFFDRNYNLCILCGRCVRICQEVRGASTISFAFRGSRAVVGTVLDRTLLESGCQFCGACVDVCPTGTLAERAVKPESLPDESLRTICPLCSLGCELKVELNEGRILRSVPSEQGAANRGQACVKGRFTLRDVVYSQQRIKRPLIRKKGELEEVDWEEALSYAAEELKKYKGTEIAVISSLQGTNEEIYLFHKFAHEALKTKNLDNSAHFSPLISYCDWIQEKGFSSEVNFKVEDISEAKTIFLIGSDLTVSNPIIGLEVIKAVRNGGNLVIINPQEIRLGRYASFWVKIKPGTDFFLLLSLAKTLIEEGELGDLSRIEGFESLNKSLDKIDVSRVFEITGVSENDLKDISKLLLEEKPPVFIFGLGLTQHPWGEENIAALWNLALLCEAQLIPLGLENNIRGELEIRRHFGTSGLSFNQIIQAARDNSLKALYLAGPFPYLVKEKPEFLVIQDSYSCENMNHADVVLPGATFAESEGTVTNLEGRIQKLNKIIEPQGEAKPDWWIIAHIAQKMGYKSFNYRKPSQILNEVKKAIPAFTDVSYPLLEKGEEIFCNEETEKKSKLIPVEYKLSSSSRKKDFPLLLLVNYNLDYYKSLNLSKEIKGLRKIRDSRWIKINPQDAAELKIEDGEEVEVESSSQRVRGIARIEDTIPHGIIDGSFLWSENPEFSIARFLSEFNPESFSLKMIPVRIRKGYKRKDNK
ncbi:MAG: molybdopterin-dependent oxidoreductase [Candidatus Aminicenantaceae bacterium]